MQNIKNITTLFLDIGGVLLSNGWDYNFRKKAAAHFHLDWDVFDDIHESMAPLFEVGKISLDDYLNRVVFYTNRDFTRTEFKDFMYSLSTSDSEMIAFIKKLKSQYKLKIIAVSNESRELNDYRIKTFKLYEIFDFFVSSCYVHFSKPDATIFQIALDGAQVPIEEIVYIDNTELFTNIATDLGITSIYHQDYKSTVKALADLGLSVPQKNINKEFSDSTVKQIKILGIASDHGGFELKIKLMELLEKAGYTLKDYGAYQLHKDDDYPDFVIPLSQAVANGEIERGIAICGSGVGACIVANKIDGVRSALITDAFSAQQGVEDDDMNIMCLGGNITGPALAWKLVQLFLNARFKNEERFIRRLNKVTAIENGNVQI
ncbi:MAG: RpiB/LacA/LacB family sugar-phosphate isomerase [Chitinophagales bacterium]